MKGIKVSEAKFNENIKRVYDIEVEDNHNFYVENFLVHNCGVFAAKKKYFARVRDNEGTRYSESDPYIKVMGLEIAKSSTPSWSKKYLKKAIPLILDKDERELRDWVNQIKQEYTTVDLNDIALVGSVSSLDYNLGVDKAIPIGSRAALCHNVYIKKSGLENQYAPIQAGDKCKRLFLVTPNPLNSNVVAYTNDTFPREIAQYVDYDTNFEKGFMAPLNMMIASLNWDVNRETECLDDW